MQYPKYIEFEDGTVIIFDPAMTHAVIAAQTGRNPVSAGFACFPYHGRGKFFGTSTTLGLSADPELDISQKLFFGGFFDVAKREIIVSTDEAVLTKLRIASAPAPFVELTDSYGTRSKVPRVTGASEVTMYRFTGIMD